MGEGDSKMTTYTIVAPDGKTYDVTGPAGASDDEVRAEVLRQHPSAGIAASTQSLGTGSKPVLSAQEQADQASQAEDLKKLQAETAGGGPIASFLSSAVHGATFGADDLLRAGIAGVGSAIQSGDISQLGRQFSNEQAAAKKYRADMASQAPIASTTGNLAGALVAPLGPVEGVAAKVGELGAKYLSGAGALAAKIGASPAVQAASEALASPLVAPIVQGAKSGATYGALTGAAENIGDPNFAGDVAGSAAGGAIGGGIGGGVLGSGAGIVGRMIADKAEANAPNVAYDMIANALKGQRNPDTGVPYTAQEIADKMQAARDIGNAPMIGDQTRNLRGMTADLSKGSDQAAGDINDALLARQQAASGRVSGGIDTALGISPTEPTAYGLKTNIAQDLQNVRNDPTTGYDAVLKAAPVWNQKLDDIFSSGSSTIQNALKLAVRNARDGVAAGDPNADPYQMVPLLKKAGVDPGTVGLTEPGTGPLTDPRSVSSTVPRAAPVTPAPTTQQVPSVYSLDQVRRALKTISNSNFNSQGGDTTLATNASTLRGNIRDAISETHPMYGSLMDAQRTLIDRSTSVDKGQSFINAMQNGNAEPWLAEAQKSNVNRSDLAVGIGDALRNSADPIGTLKSMIGNKAQNAALSWAVGGPAKLDDFTQFIQNEVEQAITEKAAGSKVASGTLAPPSETDAPLSYISREAARGLPFGIPSGVLRAMNAVKSLTGVGPNAGVRNQLAAILTSGGQELPAGAQAAAAYRAGQLAARLNRAQLAGRALPALLHQGQ